MRKTFARKREKSPGLELDITSLLDILVILLVFLLKSYNASNLKINLVDDLTLADSSSRKLGDHSVTVQIDRNLIVWIDNVKVADMKRKSEIAKFEQYLREKREGKSKETVNLVLDKELSYGTMSDIMESSNRIGYTKFKFIVQGNY